jgi:hypothetical protein
MQAPRGRGVIAPTHSLPRHWMGEWPASRHGRALPPGKDPRYPLVRRLSGPQSWSEHMLEEKPSPLPGIEPQSSSPKNTKYDGNIELLTKQRYLSLIS